MRWTHCRKRNFSTRHSPLSHLDANSTFNVHTSRRPLPFFWGGAFQNSKICSAPTACSCFRDWWTSQSRSLSSWANSCFGSMTRFISCSAAIVPHCHFSFETYSFYHPKPTFTWPHCFFSASSQSVSDSSSIVWHYFSSYQPSWGSEFMAKTPSWDFLAEQWTVQSSA